MPVSARVARLHGGEYDVFRRDELRAELEAIDPHGDVDIDFRDTTFMDAGALGLLLAFKKRLEENDAAARVRLVNLPAIVRRLLQVSGTAEVFDTGAP